MLKLGDGFVTFEACSAASDVFFDDSNQRICTVRGNGEMGITAKGLKENDVIFFRIPDQGPIKSLNFSPDSLIASVRRDETAIDFVFLQDTNVTFPPIVRQSCRNANATVLGIQWVSDTQLIFVLDEGVELYLINSKKRLIKFMKSINITVNWFASYIPSQLIFLSNGISNSVLNPFIIQSNVIHRLSRFEVDFGCSSVRPKLLDRDITIASIYQKLSVLVLKSGQQETFMMCLNIYEFSTSDPFATPQLTKILRLNLDGFIGVHVIDNAVFVHHKNSCTSLVFEVETANDLSALSSLVPSSTDIIDSNSVQEILPLCITAVEVSQNLRDSFLSFGTEVSLYSPTSAIFAPNFVADVRFGIFTKLTLSVNRIAGFIKENNSLLDFLIKRSKAEDVFLDVFKRCLLNKSIRISKICDIFHQILNPNCLIPGSPSLHRDSTNSRCSLVVTPIKRPEIDHSIILRKVFDPLRDCVEMDKTFLSYLVLEFFLIVKRMKVSLEQNYLPEFLLRVLVDAKQFNKLQQLLQYGVIDNSKFLAFELISLGKEYVPLHQMAIDMLARRDNMEQISEVLLSQGKVIEAVRCIALENHYRKSASLDRKNCLKLLEGAWKTGNRQIMYTVFTHLRNVQKIKYLDGSFEEFHRFIEEFNFLFKDEEIEEAEKRFRHARISSVSKKSRDIAINESAENHDNETSSINRESEDNEAANDSECINEKIAQGDNIDE